MAVHNAVDILGWALEPQGSAWIARQAYQYLEEEFYSFSASIELLAKVDKDTLVKVMKSDFTQASESEILQTLIRWGEQQLKMKNKDYLSPNGAMSASTSSTLSRKNAKRRQVSSNTSYFSVYFLSHGEKKFKHYVLPIQFGYLLRLVM